MSAHTSHRGTMRSLWLIVAILGNASYALGDSLIVSFGKSKVQSATGVSSASTLSTSPEPTLSTMEVSSLSGIAGVLSVSVLSHRARLALMQIPDDYNTKKLIRAILKTPGVSYVEPNRPVTAQENELEETYGRRPKDPLYDSNGETSPHEIVSLPYVWQHYTRGRGGVNAPKVCIIDTGCVSTARMNMPSKLPLNHPNNAPYYTLTSIFSLCFPPCAESTTLTLTSWKTCG